MCQDLPPLTSWEFFLFCRKALGISFLQQIFKRGLTEIYRWSRDPEFTADSKRNPLDRLRLLLKEMRNQGHEREARAGVNYLAEAVGCRLRETNRPKPDKDSYWDECLDDYPALTAFHDAVRQGKEWAEICHLAEEAKREIDETVSSCEGRDA